ncbi:hypothetical protein KFK09_021294 [Dendrobium nobile]|uniref:Uncharacterized protein n=1 Tax=Dendrobium nobile TaxID=94219 RepID=A0A8T3ANZ2_DENNO|nr:hypothetical protein KFK09_021294 [Dendrobium nobile]
MILITGLKEDPSRSIPCWIVESIDGALFMLDSELCIWMNYSVRMLNAVHSPMKMHYVTYTRYYGSVLLGIELCIG